MTDYRVGQKVLHWLAGILLILDLIIAQKFGGVMEEWDRLESRSDHATLGIIAAIILIWRIIYRLRYGAPGYPSTMPPWQVTAARGGHLLLYLFMSALVITGVASAMNATAPIAVFGSLDLTLGSDTDAAFRFIRQFHEFCTQAMIALIVLHVTAALYHHFVAKDDLLVRMFKFWRSY